MAEFRVTKINGNAFENDEEFKNFYMTQVQPKFPKSSVLTIKNDTFVKVNYHWKIENEKDHQVEDEQKARYMIEPEKGVFEPNAEKDFKITFESDVSMPFYKNISLVIDDVPIEAIRNPPEIIKKQHMEHQASDDDAKKIRPSLTYFEFSIISETLFNKVEVSPPAYIFPAAVPINRDHAYKFSLKNLSQGPVGYKVKAHSKTSDFVSCQVRNNQVIPLFHSTSTLENNVIFIYLSLFSFSLIIEGGYSRERRNRTRDNHFKRQASSKPEVCVYRRA